MNGAGRARRANAAAKRRSTVAAERDLRPDWLTGNAARYVPAGLTVEICDVLCEHPNLVVPGPPADFVFLMKRFAGRAPDYDDMVALWPKCTFGTSEETVRRLINA